jgi:hypothetical protein
MLTQAQWAWERRRAPRGGQCAKDRATARGKKINLIIAVARAGEGQQIPRPSPMVPSWHTQKKKRAGSELGRGFEVKSPMVFVKCCCCVMRERSHDTRDNRCEVLVFSCARMAIIHSHFTHWAHVQLLCRSRPRFQPLAVATDKSAGRITTAVVGTDHGRRAEAVTATTIHPLEPVLRRRPAASSQMPIRCIAE